MNILIELEEKLPYLDDKVKYLMEEIIKIGRIEDFQIKLAQ